MADNRYDLHPFNSVCVCRNCEDTRDRWEEEKTPPEEAKKNDYEKPRLDLLPVDGVIAVGEAMTYGAAKYAERNYLIGEGVDPNRYLAAGLRHIFAHISGENLDSESGLRHLAHAGASILMAIDVIEQRLRNQKEEKKR